MQNSISFSLFLTTNFSVTPTFYPLKLAGSIFSSGHIWECIYCPSNNLEFAKCLLLSALISADALTPAIPMRECCLLPPTGLVRAHRQVQRVQKQFCLPAPQEAEL